VGAEDREALTLVFAGRAVRSFAFGWLSIFLALYLARKGFGAVQIGAVFTATMVEDAVLTIVLSTIAARVGPARVMAFAAPLLVVGGLLLALPESRGLLLAGAVIGTLSPNGQEAGPFAPLEQALLARLAGSGSVVRLFGWYNLFAFFPAAAGAGLAGAAHGWALRRAFEPLKAEQGMLLAYAAAGLVLAALYTRLARLEPARRLEAVPLPTRSLGLARSRRVVFPLAGLQAVDAFAGGFIMQSLLAYWFHLRFGVSAEALGALFFGTSLLSALSFLVAARVAERMGLLNTMVFTHLPSNVLLILVPFAPTFAAAAAVLLARHLLSQMDVPTRQAYTMALVAPDERPAAAGFTAGARALAQAAAPLASGVAMATVATPVPFLLAGGLKIVYDLSLFFRFRRVPLAGDRRAT
jgi:MFS family permease